MENNLQIISNSDLPVSENQIIKSALTGTLVRLAIPYEIDGAVSVAIDKAIFYLGLKTILEDRDMIKITVIDDVKRHFPNLTISEVGIAIENGSKGLYGKVVGLAPKDVFEWLSAYSICEARKIQIAELAKQNKVKPEPTDEQKAQMRWNNLLKAWAFFKEHKYYNDYGNAVYNMLLMNGKINFTVEQKEGFKIEALKNLESEYNPLKHIGNPIKVSEMYKLVKDIHEDPKKTRVIAEAKRIALHRFFSDLAEMQMEITDLFN